MLGYAFTDTAVFGRQYDQKQWAHAFGVSLLPARTTESADELANLLTWQTGQRPIASTYRELVQAPLLFFTGVHLAGPDLTATNFQAGLFRYPPAATTVPTRMHFSWGRHKVWKGVDLTAGDDATVIWWDPNATGPDEVGNVGTGLYRYADGGARYLPERMADDQGRALRRRHVDDGAHDDPVDGRAPELSLAGALSPRPGAVLVLADDPRGVADRDAERRQRARDHGAGAHDDVLPDRRARQHHRAVPEPRARPDAHGAGCRELLADRERDVFVAVVGVGDVDVMAGEHVVADLDREVPDDAAPLPDEAPVADGDDGNVIGDVPGHDARGERRVRTDDAVGPELDVLLAVQRGDRHADRRALAERAEPAGPRAPRADGRAAHEALPSHEQGVVGSETRGVEERGHVRSVTSERVDRPERVPSCTPYHARRKGLT